MLHLYNPERLRELRGRALLRQRDVERTRRASPTRLSRTRSAGSGSRRPRRCKGNKKAAGIAAGRSSL